MHDLFYGEFHFLGITWNAWKVIGWTGNLLFFSRIVVQWYATEKLQRVVVPVAFWWLSLLGTWTLLSYAIFYRADSVFVLAYGFSWIPYIRNLVIHKKHERAHQACTHCEAPSPPGAKFCSMCGHQLEIEAEPAA